MHPLRKLILTAIFIALAIAGGLALIQLPNVEMVTVAVFLAGFLLGIARGVFVGGVAEFLYSFFNPYGVPAPPLLVAQVFSMALAGGAGGFLGKFYKTRTPPFWLLGVCGGLLTLLFDLNTTLGFTLFIESPWQGLMAAVAFGAPFYLTHIGTNTLIFTMLLPILIPRLRTLAIFRNLSIADTSSNREHSSISASAPAHHHLDRASAGP
jgi:hypothetical protein